MGLSLACLATSFPRMARKCLVLAILADLRLSVLPFDFVLLLGLSARHFAASRGGSKEGCDGSAKERMANMLAGHARLVNLTR